MAKPCGNDKCYVSTSIDEMTLTFGSGELDEWGFWEKPCFICASAWKEKYPGDHVWPTKPSNKKYRINIWLGSEVEDEDLYLYQSKEEAEMEAAHLRFLQPENKYEIEEVEE